MQYQIQKIIDITDDLVEKYDTRDPFEIADQLDLIVSLTEFRIKLKGLYIYYQEFSTGCISVNAALPEYMKIVVCAHELGHDRLHRDLCCGFFPEIESKAFFGKTEYEANLFASNLLISDDDFLYYAKLGMTREELAAELNTDPNMIDFKAVILKEKGYNINLHDCCTLFLK